LIGLKIDLLQKLIREMCNMFSPTEALFWEHYIKNKCWNNSIIENGKKIDKKIKIKKKLILILK
jgi:hypothetical protein